MILKCSSKLSLLYEAKLTAPSPLQAVPPLLLYDPKLFPPARKYHRLLALLYCQTPIPGQTWELTLLRHGNNKNDPTQILPEGVVLGL